MLSGNSEVQSATMSDWPLDPVGYFVVKDREKVILIQEQLSKIESWSRRIARRVLRLSR